MVEGNYIGTNAAGTAALATRYAAWSSPAAPAPTPSAARRPPARNVISGNTRRRRRLTGSGTTGNVVEGNYIGVDQSGNTKLANGGYGIVISATGVTSNTIGGLTGTAGSPAPGTGPGNVISGNAEYQITSARAARRSRATFSASGPMAAPPSTPSAAVSSPAPASSRALSVARTSGRGM